jgi:hypothetical protein
METQGLDTAEQTLSAYSKDLPSMIQQETQKAWSPAIKEASSEVGQQLGQFLPSYFNIPYTGLMAGTSGADVSPQRKLQAMGTGLGSLSEGLTSASRYADYMGARMDDAYNKAMKSMQTGYGMAADAYAREFDKYRLAWEAAEAEKQRQFQVEQAAASRASAGAGAFDWGSFLEQAMSEEAGTEEEIYEVDDTGAGDIGYKSPAETWWGKPGGAFTRWAPTAAFTMPAAAISDISQGQWDFPVAKAMAQEYIDPVVESWDAWKNFLGFK